MILRFEVNSYDHLPQPLLPSHDWIPVHAVPPLHVHVFVPVQALLLVHVGEHVGFTWI